MEPIFAKNFTIGPSQADAFGELKTSSLLSLMQEVAGSHYDLAEPDLLWVVSRHHVEVERLPVIGQTVRMETWALPPTRAAFPRATVCYDSQGRELFRSMSMWVLIRKDSRAMVLPGKVNLPMVTTVRGMELSKPGSLIPRQYDKHCSRQVYYSLLDTNGHMNNARYMDWVEDLLPLHFHEEYSIREFTVCYLSEGKPDAVVDIGYGLEAGTLHVEGGFGGERIFAARVTYQKKGEENP